MFEDRNLEENTNEFKEQVNLGSDQPDYGNDIKEEPVSRESAQAEYTRSEQAGGNPNNQQPPNNPNYHRPQWGGRYETPGHTQQPSQYNTTRGFEGEGNPYVQDRYQWNLNDYQHKMEPEPPKKKNRGLMVFGTIVGVVFSITLVSFAAYGLQAMINNNNTKPVEESSKMIEQSTENGSMPNITIDSKPMDTETVSSDGKMTTVQINKMVGPSVVAIEAYSQGGFAATSQGSGIIMSSDGYIITNAHVIEGATGVKVVLGNGEAYTGEVIGLDTQTDLAVVKIEEENLAYVTFGDSDEIDVGETILAIGNSWGMQGTITQGIVSGVDRIVRGETGYDMTFIQVDAAINPGNSGGALVNEYGQVIGINSAKFVSEDVEGIGFAIPINDAMPIIEDIIVNGRVTGRAKLGIEGIPIDSIDSRMYGVPVGIQIINIQEDSDLDDKGIVPGDIITAVDGDPVESFDDMKEVTTGKAPGDTIVLTIYRTSSNPLMSDTFDVEIALVEDK